MSIKVMIVEDEPELLWRLSGAVSSHQDLCLAGAVPTGEAAMTLLAMAQPDVALIDLGLPDMSGIELIHHITRHLPGMDVLVVTMFADDEHVLACIEAGASGYLLKDQREDAIVASIREVRAGGSPISPSIARRILTRLRRPPDTRRASVGSPLSPRETDILRLISKGLCFNEVGEQLQISSHTVVAHVKKIYRKLAVHSRAEAVHEAGQLGLL